jgi:hypothetical protein
MTEEKFNGAKEILESIQRAEQAIKKINRLIESNNLECELPTHAKGDGMGFMSHHSY